MSKTFAPQATALVLSAFVTFALFAGANGIATHQYAVADAAVMAQDGDAKVAVQQVVVVGHRLARA